MNELVVIDQKPDIPDNWDYEKSVEKVKLALFKRLGVDFGHLNIKKTMGTNLLYVGS